MGNNNSPPFSIPVKWKKETIYIKSLGPEDTLGDLKQELAQITKISPPFQKILGVKAKSDQDTLRSLGLPHKKLMLVGTPDHERKDAKQKTSEDVLKEVEEEVNKIKQDVSKLETTMESLENLKDQKNFSYELKKNDEVLMRQLFKLDALKGEDIRQKRKELILAIQEIQKKLDFINESFSQQKRDQEEEKEQEQQEVEKEQEEEEEEAKTSEDLA